MRGAPRQRGNPQPVQLHRVARQHQGGKQRQRGVSRQPPIDAETRLLGKELLESRIAPQHVAEQLLQFVLRVGGHVNEGLLRRRVNDHPAVAREVDFGPGVAVNRLDQQRRAAGAVGGGNRIADAHPRRNADAAQHIRRGEGEVHAIAGEVAEQERGGGVFGVGVFIGEAVDAVAVEVGLDRPGLGEGVGGVLGAQAGDDLPGQFAIARIIRQAQIFFPDFRRPGGIPRRQPKQRVQIELRHQGVGVPGALEAQRVGVGRGRERDRRVEAERRAVGHECANRGGDGFPPRAAHGLPRLGAGGGDQIPVHPRVGSEIEHVAIPLGIRAFAEIVGAPRGFVVVAENGDRHRRLLVLGVVLAVMEGVFPGLGTVPGQAEVVGHLRRGQPETAHIAHQRQAQQREQGEVVGQPAPVVLHQQQGGEQQHRATAEREQHRGRVEPPAEGEIAEEEGPVDHAVAVGGKHDGETRGDEQHFNDAANTRTLGEDAHRANQREAETQPLDRFRQMKGGDGAEQGGDEAAAGDLPGDDHAKHGQRDRRQQNEYRAQLPQQGIVFVQLGEQAGRDATGNRRDGAAAHGQ